MNALTGAVEGWLQMAVLVVVGISLLSFFLEVVRNATRDGL